MVRHDVTVKQRGRGFFEKSIESLKRLNAVGYGTNGLALDLVYNSAGPSSPLTRGHHHIRHGSPALLIPLTLPPHRSILHDLPSCFERFSMTDMTANKG